MTTEIVLIGIILVSLGTLYYHWKDEPGEQVVMDLVEQGELDRALTEVKAGHKKLQAEINAHSKSIESLSQNLGNQASSINENAQENNATQEHLQWMRDKIVALERKLDEKVNEVQNLKVTISNMPKSVPVKILRNRNEIIKARSIYKKVRKNGKSYWIKDTEYRRTQKKTHPEIKKASKAMAATNL